MATGLNEVLRHLHRVLKPPDGGLTDGQLLARFIATRDEASFAELVRRHGPMVWRLCQRVLGHVHEAEDCFQATFLVLACKAAAILKQESVGSFLYGVAYRTARKAKAIHSRRMARERQVGEMPQPEVPSSEVDDWRPRLDHELSLLHEAYRSVIVACDLEGRSRKEAARLLGLSEGTVSSRLARGRRLLAKRLSRYGLSLSGVSVATALSEGMASTVPGPLVSATGKVATLVAAGEFSAVSTSVGVLMKGAFHAMLWAKLKLAVGAVMVVVALGASGLVYRASGQSGAAGKGGGRPATELDVLRQEVELLKLKLELVERKLKAQDDELRALRADGKGGVKKEAARVNESLQEAIRKQKPDDVESLRKAEDGSMELRKLQDLQGELKALRDGERKALGLGKPAGLEAERKSLDGAAQQQKIVEDLNELLSRQTKSDPLQQAEAALKALREAPDAEARRKAADALEKALKKLRELQQKKPERAGP
jgi:RNA polymerase sigma factor (sigma-70 family)